MWKLNSKGSETIFFSLYLILYLVLAITIAFHQPLADVPLHTNPPDEHARILIPQYICKYGKLPTGFEEEVRIPAYGFSYGLYNSAPYYLQGFVMRFVDLFTDSQTTLLFAARMVNVMLGLFMAVMVYKLAGKVFEHPGAKWLFCVAITFLPQNIFIHTYVNTDSCCMLSTAVILYGLVCGYQDHFQIKSSLWLSLGIILCALSYYNAYGYILCSILLFLAYYIKRENGRISYDVKGMMRRGITISAVVLLGIGWYFIRSYVLYDGDFLGLSTRTKMAIQYAIPSVNPENAVTYRSMGYSLWQMIKETHMLDVLYTSFIGEYGSMFIVGSRWMYRFYKVFLAAGLLGSVGGLAVRLIKGKKPGFRRCFFHLNLVLCMLIPLFLLFRYAYTMDYQAQGRYILPALIPFMYYVVQGLHEWTKLKIGELQIPKRFTDICYVAAIVLILIFAVHMVYCKALPLYLESGMVM